MRFKSSHTILILFVALFASCQKDYFKPRWDVDISAPLVKTSLNLKNFLPDSLLHGEDDSTSFLYLTEFFYKIDLKGFKELFDTAYVKSFPDIPFSTKVPPGYRYIKSFESNIGAGGQEFTKVFVRSGKIKFVARSTIEEITYMTYKLPNTNNVSSNEPATLKNFKIPAGSKTTPSDTVAYFDISNCEFDLRGENFTSFNSILSEMDVRIDPKGDSVMVGGKSEIVLTISFEDMVVETARGYLGTELLTVENEEEDLGIFKNVKKGGVDLEEVNLNLNIKNYLGADLKALISQLFIISVEGDKKYLENEEINKTINFSRAKEVNSQPYPSVYPLNFTANNSNLLDLLEVLPTKVGFSGDFELNPLGNIANGNDFVYFEKTIGVEIEFKLPLKVGINGLILRDTLPFSFERNNRLENINSAKLTVIAENTFPVDAKLKLHFLDISNKLLETVKGKNSIKAGDLGGNGKVEKAKESRVYFELDAKEFKKVRKTKKLVVESEYNTVDQKIVRLYKDYSLQLIITTDLNYEIDTNK